MPAACLFRLARNCVAVLGPHERERDVSRSARYPCDAVGSGGVNGVSLHTLRFAESLAIDPRGAARKQGYARGAQSMLV
jgi:hypothetical protein